MPFSLRIQRLTQGLLCLFFGALPFSKAAVEILFPLLLLGWWIGWHLPGRQPLKVQHSLPGRAVGFALLAYVGVCAWSVGVSTDPFLSTAGLIRKTFEYALLFFIVRDVALHPQVAPRSFRALLVSAWLVAIYAVVQQLFGWDPIRGSALRYSRMVGPYENPNDLATFLLMICLPVIAQIMKEPRRSSIGLWSAGALFLGCMVWTLSRGALVGFWAGLLFLLVYSRNRRARVGSILIGLTGVVALSLRKGQLLEMLTFSDVGLRERWTMWEAAWRMFQDRLFLGHGLNTFMANYLNFAGTPNNGPSYAHNCFLQIAAETGILGLFTFLFFLTLLFWLCRKALKGISGASASEAVGEKRDLRWLLLGFLAAIGAFLVQSIFDTNLYSLRQAALFWSLAGLVAGLSDQILCARETRFESSHPPPIPTEPEDRPILERV